MRTVKGIGRRSSEFFENLTLATFDPAPQLIGDNAEFGPFIDNPFGLFIVPGDTPLGVGVLPIFPSVPDRSSEIEFIVQDSTPAVNVAADSGVAPG
jgi:hypothetical protein